MFAYARVSTYGQKDDLKIKLILLDNMLMPKGVILDETITDIGSGS